MLGTKCSGKVKGTIEQALNSSPGGLRLHKSKLGFIIICFYIMKTLRKCSYKLLTARYSDYFKDIKDLSTAISNKEIRSPVSWF